MTRIEVEQQTIAQRQSAAGRAFAGEGQYRIGGAGVMVDHHLDGHEAAGAALPDKRLAPEDISFDFLLFRAKLAPGDRAVLIGIKTDCYVEIAQRDVPLSAQLPI